MRSSEKSGTNGEIGKGNTRNSKKKKIAGNQQQKSQREQLKKVICQRRNERKRRKWCSVARRLAGFIIRRTVTTGSVKLLECFLLCWWNSINCFFYSKSLHCSTEWQEEDGNWGGCSSDSPFFFGWLNRILVDLSSQAHIERDRLIRTLQEYTETDVWPSYSAADVGLLNQTVWFMFSINCCLNQPSTTSLDQFDDMFRNRYKDEVGVCFFFYFFFLQFLLTFEGKVWPNPNSSPFEGCPVCSYKTYVASYSLT